jgi:hypothetical protein
MNRSTYAPEFKIEQDYAGIIDPQYAPYRVWFRLDPTTEWVADNRSFEDRNDAVQRDTELRVIFS